MVEMRMLTDDQCLTMATGFLERQQDRTLQVSVIDGVAEELARGFKIGIARNLIKFEPGKTPRSAGTYTLLPS